MKNVDIETQSKIYIFDQELNENENNFINLNNEIYKLQKLENDFSNKFSNILIKSVYYENKEKLYLYPPKEAKKSGTKPTHGSPFKNRHSETRLFGCHLVITIQNLDHLQSAIFLTIQNPAMFGFQIPTV